MNTRQFKDPLSSTCQVSSERRVSHMESEVPGSILTGGNISLLEIFGFHVVNHLIFSLDHVHMPIC